MAKWFLQDCLLNQKQRKWDTIPNKPSVDSNNETYHRCMPAPSKRCAKWFLKGVNSPSLRVQTPPVGRCWWMVFFVENFTQRTKKQTKLEPATLGRLRACFRCVLQRIFFFAYPKFTPSGTQSSIAIGP